jgi:DNA repair protein RadA/Sms
MAKIITRYVCQSCGYVSPRWIGKCPNCSEWNTFVEEAPPAPSARRASGTRSKLEAVSIDDVENTEAARTRVGIDEFDRVLGGGLVAGSLLLLGGDPGIGKSTLMIDRKSVV